VPVFERQETIQKMNEWGKEKTPFLFVISYNQKEIILVKQNQLHDYGIYFQTPSFRYFSQPSSELPEKVFFEKEFVTLEDFRNSFSIVKKHLDFGNTYLINLTKPTKIKTNLSFEQIFYHSQAPYKLWIDGKLVVFSPEIFVKVKDGIISSYPMKGTIDAAIPDAKEMILNDNKETAEHYTIVDLIRNDLSMVSKNVRVERFRFIDKVQSTHKTLLQVSSEIVGEVPNDFFHQLGTQLFTLLPAGSISGAPKPKTVKIIEEAEHYERGFYTGIFGYFDGESLDSAVLIRYMEQIGDEIVFKSGGGITTFSECEKEYQELLDKVYLPIY